MKKNVCIISGFLLIIFAILVLAPVTPPLSRDYIALKMQHKSVEGVNKFSNNWMFTDPIFYVRIALFVGGIFLVAKGFRSKRE